MYSILILAFFKILIKIHIGMSLNTFHCFSSFSSDEEKTGFFSINIPVKWDSSRPCSYLVKWDTTKWVELKSVKTGSDILTTIASW